MQITQIVWLVLLVLFMVAEAATATLVSVWFCAGSLVALIISLLAPGSVAVQVAVFLLVSALMLLAVRPLAKRLIGNKKVPTNADANIGKFAQVVSEVQPGRFGRVKLEGLEWTAKSGTVLPVGSWVLVEAIEGVKLVVRPVEGQPTA